MAVFACHTTNKETTTEAYKEIIQHFQKTTLKQIAEVGQSARSLTYAYYAGHKGKSTHYYKDFIYQLRKVEFINPCVIPCDNPAPHLKTYIRLIEEVKIMDGLVSNAYYGELKKTVTSFVNYFTLIIDEVIRKIDRYYVTLDTYKLMSLVDDTIDMSTVNQDQFLMEFTPVEMKSDVEKLKEIEEGHANYVAELRKLNDTLANITKVEAFEKFMKEHFEISKKKISELCSFTHTYISVMLADRLYEIAVSLEETVNRLNTNKRKYNEQSTQNINRLIHELYDKNKESLYVHRRERSRSVDSAEINRSIEMIKKKIAHYGNEESLARLELETQYWMNRLKEFNEIVRILTMLQAEQDNMCEEEETYNKLRCVDIPGPKTICFDKMGENFAKRRKYLAGKILEISKTLVTFFCVRGRDRILYSDNLGAYYCDEFNHQNYVTDYSLKFYHVNCEGKFVENIETDPYFFDENGRYTLVNGEKIHQCAPCTSQYKLGNDGLFSKVTVDCGHSNKLNKKCRMELKDITDQEILPTKEILDITRTLDADTVKYLWDSFGMVLPEVLYNLAKIKPKNPIHYLSHELLKRRSQSTKSELDACKQMADKYRADIYKKRKEKAAAANLDWKSKLVKRRKPEESDDTNEWAVYNQHAANENLIYSLNYYNN